MITAPERPAGAGLRPVYPLVLWIEALSGVPSADQYPRLGAGRKA
jgi:hypothetical protein